MPGPAGWRADGASAARGGARVVATSPGFLIGLRIMKPRSSTALLLPLALLFGCDNSKVPDTALWYSVTVTGVGPDECNPGNTQGYQETFEYAVAFTASDADIYVNGEPFAAGVLNGCNLTYQTVVIGEDTERGPVKWQLSGQAIIDAGDDSCAQGDGDWQGTETFTIIDSDVEEIEIGCTYPMETLGNYQPDAG